MWNLNFVQSAIIMFAMRAIPNVESKYFTSGILYVAVCRLALMNGVKYSEQWWATNKAQSVAITGTKTKKLWHTTVATRVPPLSPDTTYYRTAYSNRRTLEHNCLDKPVRSHAIRSVCFNAACPGEKTENPQFSLRFFRLGTRLMWAGLAPAPACAIYI